MGDAGLRPGGVRNVRNSSYFACIQPTAIAQPASLNQAYDSVVCPVCHNQSGHLGAASCWSVPDHVEEVLHRISAIERRELI